MADTCSAEDRKRGWPRVLMVLAFAALMPAAGMAMEFPKVQVTKSVAPLGPDKTGLDMLESTRLTISLKGDTRSYPGGVETAVVLILDESGSMDGDEGASRGAAKAVVNMLKAGDKVGLVAFDGGIKKKVALTSTHGDVIAAINGLDDPDGATNALAAVKEANAMLKADKTAIRRIAIFFTDGAPTPLTQIDDILDTVPALNTSKIAYYTVAYGNFLQSWLKSLSQDTGGSFCGAATSASISTCFTDAFKKGSQTVSAQDVWINEVLSADFKAVPGTLNYSMGGTLGAEPPGFKAAMGAAEQALYQTGVLKTPPIFELPAGRSFNVSFDITPVTCTDKLRTLGTDDIQKTHLTYAFGPKNLQILYPEFNQAFVQVSPCGVYVTKSFDQANRVITISLRNTFQDREVMDVHLREVVGPLVLPRIGEATPSHWQGRQVTWPLYPEGESWKANGVEWRLFTALPPGPGTPTSLFPPIGYTVDSHGYVEKGKEMKFRLPIDARAEAAGKSNVLINEGWRPNIDGGSATGSSLTFWYKVPIGAPHPKSENVQGLTYRYNYESISGSSEWGARRHVTIHLPDLTVPSLKPEWPFTPGPLEADLPPPDRGPLDPLEPGPFTPVPRP